jgi:hypothetical protein
VRLESVPPTSSVRETNVARRGRSMPYNTKNFRCAGEYTLRSVECVPDYGHPTTKKKHQGVRKGANLKKNYHIITLISLTYKVRGKEETIHELSGCQARARPKEPPQVLTVAPASSPESWEGRRSR